MQHGWWCAQSKDGMFLALERRLSWGCFALWMHVSSLCHSLASTFRMPFGAVACAWRKNRWLGNWFCWRIKARLRWICPLPCRRIGGMSFIRDVVSPFSAQDGSFHHKLYPYWDGCTSQPRTWIRVVIVFIKRRIRRNVAMLSEQNWDLTN